MNRKELQALAAIRLREAQLLLANGEYSGAYYLFGYVVECGLKAAIAKLTKRHDFPDKPLADASWIHDLVKLLRAAKLEQALASEELADPAFVANWALVKDWSERSRYRKSTEQEAKNIANAITDRNHGVLRWLKRCW